ncbi:hypothetical protein EG68_04697 [Paragonimus skrjabini miyazakii]|uniref:Uncharacterized protein n=1 Tax=Paragonimus skrjabini miyazakii TaxID=59628 RepID=A0A8S9YU86_9TREM|nr:hypothetical protein EG68_04697 [Paragonimus skrjabini miyazakii]
MYHNSRGALYLITVLSFWGFDIHVKAARIPGVIDIVGFVSKNQNPVVWITDYAKPSSKEAKMLLADIRNQTAAAWEAAPELEKVVRPEVTWVQAHKGPKNVLVLRTKLTFKNDQLLDLGIQYNTKAFYDFLSKKLLNKRFTDHFYYSYIEKITDNLGARHSVTKLPIILLVLGLGFW